MRLRSTRRLARGVAAVAAATALTVIPAVPSHASTYQYLVGHPMYMSGGLCTGGYTVVGASGMFTMAAGHCGYPGRTVSGTSAAYGTVAHLKPSSQGGSLLVSAYSGVTQYQIIVDPLTGLAPGGGGKVVRVMPTSQQTNDTRIDKMGFTTGWTEGKITGTTSWFGRAAICTTAITRAGDSGGPVWRYDQYGLRAVGMIVAHHDVTHGGCYHPMDQLLHEWGATLPTFGSSAASTTGPGDLSLSDLPWIDPSHHVPAGG